MKARVWDRFHQMPKGREFEIYHYAEDELQPVWYHAHPYYEIYFFVQGHNRIIVEGIDIQPERGDVLIYPPGIMHRCIHLDTEITYERFYYYLSPEFLQAISSAEFDIPETLAQMTADDHYYFHVDSGALDQLIQKADEVITASESLLPADKLMNRFRMGQLLVQSLMMLTTNEAMPQSEYSSRMSALIHYINQHAAEQVALDQLEDIFYASKYVLMKEFKEYTGITIYQYLLIRRVLMAQEMIQQGMKPKEAALHCGFQDYTSFYRAFKTRAGVSPEQYRKMIGK